MSAREFELSVYLVIYRRSFQFQSFPILPRFCEVYPIAENSPRALCARVRAARQYIAISRDAAPRDATNLRVYPRFPPARPCTGIVHRPDTNIVVPDSGLAHARTVLHEYTYARGARRFFTFLSPIARARWRRPVTSAKAGARARLLSRKDQQRGQLVSQQAGYIGIVVEARRFLRGPSIAVHYSIAAWKRARATTDRGSN